MTLLAIPNVSEGRDAERIAAFVAIISADARVLDAHSDADHNRSVFTVTGHPDGLITAMERIAIEAAGIDLRTHDGVHPRLGGLDVCPFVPHDAPMAEAVDAARRMASRIGEAGIPVYLYGGAALRAEAGELPDIRRGGLERLIRRAADDFPPDAGPRRIDPAVGVVCVGARPPLIAFNVRLRCDAATAAAIASEIRTGGGGRPAVRALGLPVDRGLLSQVSMNLIDPAVTGIEDAFDAVARRARARGATVVATEIVGLVPERFMPAPDATAARLLIEPGRSLESALGA